MMLSCMKEGSQRGVAVAMVLMAAMAGCTGESPRLADGQAGHGGNQPPVVRLGRIVPAPIRLDGTVSVLTEADDSEGDKIALRYQWLVNGQPVPGETEDQFPARLLKRGDQVTVEIVPSDGRSEGIVFRASPVLVENTAPVVQQILFEPHQIIPGTPVRATADIADPDHDAVRLTYRWWRNQVLVKEGSEDVFDTTGLASKDVVRVEVVPHDGIVAGAAGSAQLVVGNRSPEILSSPGNPVSRTHYEYIVKASDADGDVISFVLEAGPPGMVMDAHTGRLTWSIPTGHVGSHKVRVVAEDGHGGTSTQEFELTINAQPAA